MLVLKLRYGQEDSTLIDSAKAAELLSQARGEPVRLAWEDQHAFLLLVGEQAADAACWQRDA